MGGASRKSISGLLWLTFRVVGQVLITPFLAFLFTYFFDIQINGSGIDLDFRKEMLPWIFTASLVYAMMALVLALTFGGGFRPLSVIERGGWLSVLRLTRRQGDASLRREARQRYATSAHGRLSLLVHQRHLSGHRITATHGGLVLLAIPLQVLLATVPLAFVLAVPDTIMREDRRLEMAILVYLACFILAMKVFPLIARRYIGLATVTRRWLGSMGAVSSLTPILMLWILGRMANVAVLGSMGEDISLSIQIEKELFESSFAIRSIPETSFVDLLTALAVMPLAAFTTLAALGAGAEPPDWIYDHNPAKEPHSATKEPSSSSLVGKGATMAVGAITAVATGAAVSAAAQTSTALQGLAGLGGSAPLTQAPSAIQQVRSTIDPIPLEALNERSPLDDLGGSVEAFEQVSEITSSPQMDAVNHVIESTGSPSFDQPSITGLRKTG
ncbi:MAG: hypothetical protein QNL20_04540 [Euryarchaeota archaeon]